MLIRISKRATKGAREIQPNASFSAEVDMLRGGNPLKISIVNTELKSVFIKTDYKG